MSIATRQDAQQVQEQINVARVQANQILTNQIPENRVNSGIYNQQYQQAVITQRAQASENLKQLEQSQQQLNQYKEQQVQAQQAQEAYQAAQQQYSDYQTGYNLGRNAASGNFAVPVNQLKASQQQGYWDGLSGARDETERYNSLVERNKQIAQASSQGFIPQLDPSGNVISFLDVQNYKNIPVNNIVPYAQQSSSDTLQRLQAGGLITQSGQSASIPSANQLPVGTPIGSAPNGGILVVNSNGGVTVAELGKSTNLGNGVGFTPDIQGGGYTVEGTHYNAPYVPAYQSSQNYPNANQPTQNPQKQITPEFANYIQTGQYNSATTQVMNNQIFYNQINALPNVILSNLKSEGATILDFSRGAIRDVLEIGNSANIPAEMLSNLIPQSAFSSDFKAQKKINEDYLNTIATPAQGIASAVTIGLTAINWETGIGTLLFSQQKINNLFSFVETQPILPTARQSLLESEYKDYLSAQKDLSKYSLVTQENFQDYTRSLNTFNNAVEKYNTTLNAPATFRELLFEAGIGVAEGYAFGLGSSFLRGISKPILGEGEKTLLTRGISYAGTGLDIYFKGKIVGSGADIIQAAKAKDISSVEVGTVSLVSSFAGYNLGQKSGAYLTEPIRIKLELPKPITYESPALLINSVKGEGETTNLAIMAASGVKEQRSAFFAKRIDVMLARAQNIISLGNKGLPSDIKGTYGTSLSFEDLNKIVQGRELVVEKAQISIGMTKMFYLSNSGEILGSPISMAGTGFEVETMSGGVRMDIVKGTKSRINTPIITYLEGAMYNSDMELNKVNRAELFKTLLKSLETAEQRKNIRGRQKINKNGMSFIKEGNLLEFAQAFPKEQKVYFGATKSTKIGTSPLSSDVLKLSSPGRRTSRSEFAMLPTTVYARTFPEIESGLKEINLIKENIGAVETSLPRRNTPRTSTSIKGTTLRLEYFKPSQGEEITHIDFRKPESGQAQKQISKANIAAQLNTLVKLKATGINEVAKTLRPRVTNPVKTEQSATRYFAPVSLYYGQGTYERTTESVTSFGFVKTGGINKFSTGTDFINSNSFGQGYRAAQITSPLSAQESLLNTKSLTITKVSSAVIPSEITKEVTKELTRNLQKQSPKEITKQVQKNPPKQINIMIPTIPQIIPQNSIGYFSLGLPRKKNNFKKRTESGGISIFMRRFGKFNLLASGLSAYQAETLGESKVFGTLGRTIRFTGPKGELNKLTIGREFRQPAPKSKLKAPYTFVQINALSHGAEISEIQSYRRKRR